MFHFACAVEISTQVGLIGLHQFKRIDHGSQLIVARPPVTRGIAPITLGSVKKLAFVKTSYFEAVSVGVFGTNRNVTYTKQDHLF